MIDTIDLKDPSPSMLYITYDGLLDPLGASQILPYVEGIAAHPRAVHILSFEKTARLIGSEATLREKLSGRDITWTPLTFTRGFGLAGKVWDLLRMHVCAFRIALKARSAIIHARGHAAAQVGLFLKRWLGLKLIFDFRGLWVDERVDKGGWDLDKPFHRMQYRYYKRLERRLLHKADQIVVLTQAVVDEVVRLGAGTREKITIIPCCADFDHFELADATAQKSARASLGIPQDAYVLGYLGSVGGMYLSDRFFRFVELAVRKNPNVQVLALTPDVERFNAELHKFLAAELHPVTHARSASRDEVAKLLPAMDVLVAFARPSYARISMSPTKLAESFAAGIPAVCNFGVGDVTEVVHQLDAGMVLDAESDAALQAVVNELPSIIIKGGAKLREAARPVLGLELAAIRYRNIYQNLESLC